MNPAESLEAQIAVVGAGPTGLATALALATSGCRTILIDRPTKAADTRTTALLGGSIDLLRNLGVWQSCLVHGAPLRTIRIADATGRLPRAPTVNFLAAEIGMEAFGYNVPNVRLISALKERAEACALLTTIIGDGVSAIECEAGCARLSLADGRSIRVQLVVGADGRASLCRAAAGIQSSEHRYDQSAIACNIEHAAPHDGVSAELHRDCGPLTLVPLPSPFASGLVWVDRPHEAERLARLDETAFAGELERHISAYAGRVTQVGPRSVFPLMHMIAEPIAANRTALVGEAAHVLPPIGAQGLNLGFRDVAALADVVSASAAIGEDPGGQRTLRAYIRARRNDVMTRSFAVDLLNRSLLTGFLPAQFARTIGLQALDAVPFLRRAAMRAGLGP